MKLTLKHLNEYFDLTPLNDKADVEREIKDKRLTRLGLSLSMSTEKNIAYKYAVIGWGTKEYKYLKTLKSDERVKRFANTIDKNTPAIFLSQGWEKGPILKELVDRANKFSIPVYLIQKHLSAITTQLNNHFLKHTDVIDSVHGSLVVINGVGVLLKGKSGIGKSEALLELIQKGHIFISDDTVEISHYGGMIMGSANYITKDFLEVRGIGLINIPYIYGAKSAMDLYRISLVIELVAEKDLQKVDRLGNADLKAELAGLSLPLIQLPISTGRSIGSLVEAAVSAFLAKKEGMNPLDVIKKRRDKGEQNA